MRQKDFQDVVATTIRNTQKLLTVKGGEYAGSQDRLSNFKRGAELTGTTPLQVAFVYASKHYDGIATYIRRDSTGEVQAMSEPIEGRLDDLINYCILMKAIIKEAQDAEDPFTSSNLNYEFSPILGKAQTDKERNIDANSSNNSAPIPSLGNPTTWPYSITDN